MKRIVRCLLILLCAFAALPALANEAQVRMCCLSLRFQRLKDRSLGYDLDLSTFVYGVNGELAPGFVTTYTHGAKASLLDEIMWDPDEGLIGINLPATDADQNGIADFFEVEKGVDLQTSGAYSIDFWGSGAVNATWRRAAGQKDGECWLKMSYFTFYGYFELLEFTGPLSYTPGSSTVTGMVHLTQTMNPEVTMGGPVSWVKVETNRFNLLLLQPGEWTNVWDQTLPFLDAQSRRSGSRPANYDGYFEFEDFDPGSPYDPDFCYWILRVTDLNDANHNGIPDFSDDPGGAPLRAPSLALTRNGGQLLLSIAGEVGHVHRVEEALTLAPPDWREISVFSLTSDPQTILIPAPSGTRFWRVVAQ